MITQAIKGWLQKLFAWWPRKQSTPMEYQHVASSVSRGFPSEAPSWSVREGTAPQAGTTPRLSTLENHPEWFVQSYSENAGMPPQSIPTAPINFDLESTTGGENSQNAPTVQQRLEFLRYLVERGIVNEGFEQKKSGSQS